MNHVAEEVRGRSVGGRSVPIYALGVLALLFVAAVSGDGDADRDDRSGEPSISGVLSACHDDVRQGLKAPSTARFPSLWSSDANVYVNDAKNIYRVESWVDAENVYGAMLRKDITCVFRWDGRKLERDQSLELDAALRDALEQVSN